MQTRDVFNPMEMIVGWKNVSVPCFPPAWRGLGRSLGQREEFSCSFMKLCSNPCLNAASPTQCPMQSTRPSIAEGLAARPLAGCFITVSTTPPKCVRAGELLCPISHPLPLMWMGGQGTQGGDAGGGGLGFGGNLRKGEGMWGSGML